MNLDGRKSISKSYFDQSILLFEDGEYEKALGKINKAIELEYNLPDYHMVKGEILALLGRDDEALQEAKKGLEFGHNDSKFHGMYGGVLYHIGKFEDAVNELRKALEMDSENPDSHYLLGASLMELDRNNEALAAMKRSSALQPSDPWPHFMIAEIYYQDGSLKQALRELDIGLRFDRKNEDYRLMRVDILEDMGKERETMEEINKSLKIIPDSDKILRRKAEILLDQGKYAESISTLMSYISSGHTDPDIILDASDNLKSMGLHESALQLIDEVLQIEDSENLMAEKLSILEEMKRYDEAINLADKWTSSGKHGFDIRREKMFILLDLKRYAEAEEYARETYSERPDDDEALSLLIMCMEDNGKNNEIIGLVDQFVEKNGERPNILRDKSIALGRMGRYDEEVSILRRIRELSGANLLDVYVLANALYQSGKLDEALSQLDEFPGINELSFFRVFLKGKIIAEKSGVEAGIDFLKENYVTINKEVLCNFAYIESSFEKNSHEREFSARFMEEECNEFRDKLSQVKADGENSI